MSSSAIPYGKQNITDEDIQAVVSVLKSDFLTQGPKVKEFEDAFAAYVGSKYAVAVSNGTTALHLCNLALGIKPGQKVITTPNTFVATSNGTLYGGGEVVFSDIDPETYCLDPNRVEDLLRKNSKDIVGIIPVSFAGYPVKLEDFKAIAKKYHLWLIEDACHAPGAFYRDSEGSVKRSGSCVDSDFSVFSFHPVKHIACGEGGMITTNDESLYKKVLLLRTHGITRDSAAMSQFDGPWYYQMQELGYNYRIPDMLCALGLSQLNRADQSLQHRIKLAKRYNEHLKDLPICLPLVPINVNHAYHLYVITTPRRDELFKSLKEKNIHPQVHYIPVHTHPYYIQRYGRQSFPHAEEYYKTALSIPMYHSMTFEEQDRVISAIKSFFRSET